MTLESKILARKSVLYYLTGRYDRYKIMRTNKDI